MPSLLVITVSYVVLFVLIAIHTKHSLDQITSISTPPPKPTNQKKENVNNLAVRSKTHGLQLLGCSLNHTILIGPNVDPSQFSSQI